MRVDAHHHLWDLAVRDQPWTVGLPALRRAFTLDDLRPCLHRNAIDRTVLVQTVCVPGETPEMLALAARDVLVGGVVGWVDLTAADVAERLDELVASPGGAKLVGIRHQLQLEPDPSWLCRADVRRGLAAVAAAGLAYDFVVTADQLPAVIDTARTLPSLRCVLDHGGKPAIRAGDLEPWRSSIAELSVLPNAAVKLSGLATEADWADWSVETLRPYADILLESFGPHRLMFGSDWPVCLLAGSYDEMVDASQMLTGSLSSAEQDAVFGATATRWYELRP